MKNPDSTMTRTDRNLWNAIVSEAMAHLKYSAYAHKALEEGYPEVAQVFQEVAGAETIHGMNHLRVSGEVRSSVENLKNVVTGESKEISTMYPRMVKDALDDGRMDAADTFTLAMDRGAAPPGGIHQGPGGAGGQAAAVNRGVGDLSRRRNGKASGTPAGRRARNVPHLHQGQAGSRGRALAGSRRRAHS